MEDEKKKFLKLMSYLESSGNKNTDHKRMEKGLHAGSQAQGQYGLMPKTVAEFANRAIRDNHDLPVDLDVKQKANDPLVIEKMLQNSPQMEELYANRIAEKALTKAEGDQALAASMWRMGHNDTKEQALKKLQNNPGYQERIARAQEILNMEQEKEPAQENMIKKMLEDIFKGGKNGSK